MNDPVGRASRAKQTRRLTLCPFCGIRPPTSEEHVYPDWLNKRGYGSFGMREYTDHTGTETLVHQPGGVFTKTCRAVCQDCNNGRLSQLETRAEPLLLSLIETKSQVALCKPDQETLAQWAFKTAVILSHASNNRHLIPTEHSRHLHVEQRLSDHVQVWIGHASNTAEELGLAIGSFHGEPQQVNETERGQIRMVRAYIASFRLFTVAFSIFGYVASRIPLQLTLSDDLQRALLPLHPLEHEAIWWPPGTSLDVLGGVEGLREIEKQGSTIFLNG